MLYLILFPKKASILSFGLDSLRLVEPTPRRGGVLTVDAESLTVSGGGGKERVSPPPVSASVGLSRPRPRDELGVFDKGGEIFFEKP